MGWSILLDYMCLIAFEAKIGLSIKLSPIIPVLKSSVLVGLFSVEIVRTLQDSFSRKSVLSKIWLLQASVLWSIIDSKLLISLFCFTYAVMCKKLKLTAWRIVSDNKPKTSRRNVDYQVSSIDKKEKLSWSVQHVWLEEACKLIWYPKISILL